MAERCFGQQLLETDGCNPAFFYLLAKENKRSLRSCELHIPMTILFEQGYVKALFTTEQPTERDAIRGGGVSGPNDANGSGGGGLGLSDTPGEIKRKSGKDVDLNEVYDSLVAGTKEGDIVAELLFAQTPTGEMNSVQFLDSKMLHRFLFVDVDKPKSLLQKFIRPKGNNNFKILATWSPLMIMAEGRRCPNSLTSRHLPVSIRGATFEDPTINAVDVVVNRTVVRGINEICCGMAGHFERTEKLSLTRFGGFFKVDENNRLYLTYPTSIRMHECDATDKVRAPVSLSAKVSIAKNDLNRGVGSTTGVGSGGANGGAGAVNSSMANIVSSLGGGGGGVGGPAPFGRAKEALTQQVLDAIEGVLEDHDKKLRGGDMIINVPSLEDNYSLIRNALHGTRVSRNTNNNSSIGNASTARGAHGTSSVYLSGPLPAGMTTSTKRASSSMGGGPASSSYGGLHHPQQQRRAQSAMGGFMDNDMMSGGGAPSSAAYEKGIGAHSNTNYANPKTHATSTRKTFYSSNMAGSLGANPHASDPTMFVNPANTSATAAASASFGHGGANGSYYGGHNSSNGNSNNRWQQQHQQQFSNNNYSTNASAMGGGAVSRKRQAIEEKGGRVVPLMPNTQLPQPRALLPYQHALPNSATNMSYNSPSGGVGVASIEGGGHNNSATANNTTNGSFGQPATLRQLNKRSEKQIQSDWQSFISQAETDLKHFEAREHAAAVRLARQGALGAGGSPFAGGGGSSPTLNEANQRVSALEAAYLQNNNNNVSAQLFADSPSVLEGTNARGNSPLFNNNASSPPPPVKAHSTYDPQRPQKAMHVVHENPLDATAASLSSTQQQQQQQQKGSAATEAGMRPHERDREAYMGLLASRGGVGTPSSAHGGRGAAGGAHSGTAATGASSPGGNGGGIAPPTDYEADAQLFVTAIQKEYQQQNHSGLSPAALLGGGKRPASSGGVYGATAADAHGALSNVSKSVLLPTVFSPLLNSSSGAGAGTSQSMAGTAASASAFMLNARTTAQQSPTRVASPSAMAYNASSQPQARQQMGSAGGGRLRPLQSTNNGSAISQTAKSSTADREPAGLGDGGFGSGPTTGKASGKRSSPTMGAATNPNSVPNKLAPISAIKPNTTASNANQPVGGAASDSSFVYGSNKTYSFLKELERERAEAERQTLEAKQTDTALLLQNLTPADREAVEAGCEALVADFRAYLNELAYALYDLFLMRREGLKSQRFAYVEVPEKFQSFVSAGVLNSILWKLHGKVVPTLKFLCDTMPQGDGTVRDISEWRAQLLGGLQAGALGRNWPCRGNFRSIGEFLQYCTAPLKPSELLNPPSDGPSAVASNNNNSSTFAALGGSAGGSGVTLNLICDAIVMERFGGGNNMFGGVDDLLDGITTGAGDASAANNSSPSPTRAGRGGATAELMPISAIRRKSLIATAAAATNNNSTANHFTSIAGGGGSGQQTKSTAANASAKAGASQSAHGALLAAIAANDAASEANKPFTVAHLIAEHKEERRRHRIALVSQQMAAELQARQRLIQEAKASGVDEEAYLAKHGYGPTNAANGGGEFDDADGLDDEDDDEEEEILSDETVRAFNKNFCIVIPLLDHKGLEIVKTEGFLIDRRSAGFFYRSEEGEGEEGDHGTVGSSGLAPGRGGIAGSSEGIIPIYARWYLLDKLSEGSHRDARTARRRAARRLLRQQQQERQKQQVQSDERQAALAAAAVFSSAAARHQRTIAAEGASSSNAGTPATKALANGAGTGAAPTAAGLRFAAGAAENASASASQPPSTAAPPALKSSKAAAAARSNAAEAAAAPQHNPLDIVCQRCNSCRVLCVCDRVFMASGGARLRPIN